jgi:hypothetical protein
MSRKILAVPVIAALAAVALAATAQAGSYEHFQSPSGNIVCAMIAFDVKAYASCEISDHTWVAPPRPAVCEGAWGNRIELSQGSAPELVCSSDTLRGGDIATLNYGSTWSVNPITCDSEVNGITCTDTSTGHYFRISRESFELH